MNQEVNKIYMLKEAGGACVYKKWIPFEDTAAAKSLQSCPTLYDPIDGSPPSSPVPDTRSRQIQKTA